MNRRAQAIVMALLGGAILKACLTDVYLRYVKEGLQPFLLGAGTLLLVAATMTLYYDLRAGDEGHGHDHHESRAGWLLILPALAVLLIAPPALGSYAAGQAGSALASAQVESEFSPLPPGDPVPLSLMDYGTRAIFDEGRSLAGRRLRLIGFISTGPDGRPMLTRMTMACCAADGRPIKVGLAGGVTVEAPVDTWVQVVGVWSSRVEKDPVNQAHVPYLEVTDWQQTTAPRRPYE
ncbi:TIGR03943 family putative permease subunit [Actinoplanes xinjiangensis]|uniref:Putative repeat protein (TIGR03943 family) n=1 Tax=Actinoplanes xinjiangensis TaxID=512350 RepID=A0A316FHN0_9ACTN|nr:TIGR03943 family protein [Actinoplanes xinjiangensis]PWK48274.1 putative repeat protein (TIGR03943 family) [Actinoplanes xinjiangensis]GIF38971.1 membrane protein [Actinoplanes xinjiangensis]